jgi:hypothetical protein
MILSGTSLQDLDIDSTIVDDDAARYPIGIFLCKNF